MINITDKNNCCGCESCVQKCPKRCIKMEQDEELFYYPVVDSTNCIDCGLCEKVCPQLHTDTPKDPIGVYAVKNPNDEERIHSSSGGVFIALARYFIQKSGIVFGVVYDKDWNVRFTSAKSMDEVLPMMGSKYVQARVDDAYIKVENFLKVGRDVLFTGTPCHIAGLKKFLRKDYKNLFTMDVLCAGAPSPGVWSRYVKDIIYPAAFKAVGKNSVLSSLESVPSIEGIEFRDKSLHGWEKYSFVVWGKSVSKADQNTVLLSGKHDDNSFMQGFLSSVYKRRSCHYCKFRKGESGSDMTIADFWGIKQVLPDFADDKGVSLVLIRTEQAEQILSALDLESKQSDFATVQPLNGGFNDKIKIHTKRKTFYAVLNQTKSFEDAITAAMHLSLIERISCLSSVFYVNYYI